MKYHINPETQRPNQCRATKRACPVGGDHYDSPEEARAAIEQREAMEQDLVPAPVSKKAKSAQEVFSELSPEDQAELLELLQERRDQKAANGAVVDAYRAAMPGGVSNLIYLDSLTNHVKNSVGNYAERYQPGCHGCSPPYDDYCRCARYHTNPVGLNARGMALDLFNSLSPQGTYVYSDSRPTDEQEMVISDLTARIEQAGLDNPNLYEVVAYGGYYGEEFDRIDTADAAYAKLEQLRFEFDKLFS